MDNFNKTKTENSESGREGGSAGHLQAIYY